MFSAAEPSPPCVTDAASIRTEVSTQLGKIEAAIEKPGVEWVTRAGFNVAWTDYHNTDAALIDLASTDTLIDIGISDLLRLDGADIKGRAALQNNLGAALIALDPKIELYVSALVPKEAKDEKACADKAAVVDKPDADTKPVSQGYWNGVKQSLLALIGKASGSITKSATDDAPDVDPADCETERRSRMIIQAIHRSLNTYRGTRWSELGRARWQLMITTTVAGIVAFFLLALGLIRGIHPEQLMTGWAYFLVGAVAGLFLRLYLASKESQVSDDYGLEAARVYQTPLLSGMAAVIGVVLMASVAGSNLADVLTPDPDSAAVAMASPEASADASASPAATTSPAPTPTPLPSGGASASVDEPAASKQATEATLANAFNLGTYPVGLVVALAFGLTPNLVLRRLGVSASKAKEDLSRFETDVRGSPSMPRHLARTVGAAASRSSNTRHTTADPNGGVEELDKESPESRAMPYPLGQPSHGPESFRHGTALCLSGGGMRAALFHLGAVRRANELGLKLRTVSAVSGGAIFAGFLVARAPMRTFEDSELRSLSLPIEDWDKRIAEPFRKFASRNHRVRPLLHRFFSVESVARLRLLLCSRPTNHEACDARSFMGRVSDIPRRYFRRYRPLHR